MMDDGKVISLRMGNEELDSLDDFLSGHPELGGRSLFIRTAIREYIERDAGVLQKSDNDVAVRFTRAELEVIDTLVNDGIYLERKDAIRDMVNEYIRPENEIRKRANETYAIATSSLER